MKALIISDSHGNRARLREVFGRVGRVDMVIHLGDVCGDEKFIQESVDCPVHIVKGNCDHSMVLADEDVLVIGDKKILITHGHKYMVNYGYGRIVEKAQDDGFDMVMFGHTHVPVVEMLAGVQIVNPGSVAEPRQLGRKYSFAIMEVDAEKNFHFSIDYLSEML